MEYEKNTWVPASSHTCGKAISISIEQFEVTHNVFSATKKYVGRFKDQDMYTTWGDIPQDWPRSSKAKSFPDIK